MSNNITLDLVTTDEGIHTVFNRTIGEAYHSMHGSLGESMHVFIENGLNAVTTSQSELKILEIGFGTGLNALLTWRESLRRRQPVHYSAVEKSPLSADIISRLNYFDFIEPSLKKVFLQMHLAGWSEHTAIRLDDSENIRFALYKMKADFLDLDPGNGYNLIYFDAFSPSHQPELWTLEIFKKLYQICSNHAILVTYCAKGEVKRMMDKAGFSVESLPGPKGKREMIRAGKVEHLRMF
ncbi:MAG: tRNA (5-methylaminomethyl-2-thiouridine)(34)-methyltransferase MnmD [Bacteroidia bacterium]|nr:tRNA (5-methylaminomethyl-2-thiouridine)(34)-methyltransferase MnmD [Ignavibacteria bacterium]MCZ2276405.1 tRNA (5-methylaminomethyl-2-thiouridine)(34)-methyltransferase MnmD [Bacteroidia bacterium]